MFCSYIHPEKVIEIQEALGADIIMSLIECPPYPSTRQYVEKSLATTLDWQKSKKHLPIVNIRHFLE